MAMNMYDKYRQFQFESTAWDFETPGGSGIKCSIHTVTEVPDQNLDDYFNDATNEVTGSNYTAHGNVCATPTTTMDGSGLVKCDVDDPATWLQHASGFSDGRVIVFSRDTAGADSTDNLICYEINGVDFGNIAGDLTIQINTGGLFQSAR